MYHPAAATFSEAEAVRIGFGEERSDIDISVRLTPMMTIAGTVIGPDGPAAQHPGDAHAWVARRCRHVAALGSVSDRDRL